MSAACHRVMTGFAEHQGVSAGLGRLRFSSAAGVAAVVLMGSETGEPKLLSQQDLKWPGPSGASSAAEAILSSLSAGLELSPSAAVSAARAETGLFAVGPFLFPGFPSSQCSPVPARCADRCSRGGQGCVLCVILPGCRGWRCKSSLILLSTPAPQSVPLGSFHVRRCALPEQTLSHLLKESTYLSGGSPGSALPLTSPLGQSLFSP